MILMKDIIREGNSHLKRKAVACKIPVTIEDRKTCLSLLEYVINSQNDQKAEELNLRPAVGLAAPQIDINKRMFAILTNDEEGNPHCYAMINPKITKRSSQMTYLPDGEGCLSVDRETHGLTPRNYEIEIEGYNFNFQKNDFELIKKKLKGYVAVVFQHEYDHLDGILYVDKLYDIIENAKPLFSDED